MSNTLQIRRGTKAALDLITLAAGELGWASDTKGLYIGDGANNNLYATEYIDWSATGAEDIHNDRLSGVILANGSVPLTANWNIGNFMLGINTVPSYPFHLNYTPGDISGTGLYLNIDPTGTHTAGRQYYGIYLNIDTSVDQDIYSSTLKGIEVNVNDTGKLGEVYAIYSLALHNNANTTNTLVASKNQAYLYAGAVTNAYASSNTLFYSAADGSSGYGIFSSVQMSASTKTLGVAYANYNRIIQTAGTLTTGYLYYGSFSGTVGTKWGIYLSGEDKNYFSGTVGIGQASPTSPLHLLHSPGDEAFSQIHAYLSPTGTHTTSRTIHGIYVQILSTAADGGFTSALRGISAYVNSVGDMAEIYGAHFEAYYSNAATINLIAGCRTITTINAGSVSNSYGIRNELLFTGTSGSTSAAGIRTRVSMNGSGTVGTAYGIYAILQQAAGTLTTAYVLYAQYIGTIGTKWGIYLTGEDKSYFSGKVGIGESSPSDTLAIVGTMRISNSAKTRIMATTFGSEYYDEWYYNGSTWFIPFVMSDTKANLGFISFNSGWVGIPSLLVNTMEGSAGTSINEFSTDGTLGGDSDNAVPTEKAVKTYIDSATGTSSGCKVTMASDQSITTATWTVMNFDTEAYDNQNEFDTSAHKFTAKIAGMYAVSALGAIDNIEISDYVRIAIYKNNAIYAGSTRSEAGATGDNVVLSASIVKLDPGDYITIKIYHNFGADRALLAAASITQLVIQKITAASEHGSAHENASYVKVSDVKTSGTAGGTFTQDAWQTRTLNTEDNDPDAVCTLSSNQIELAAGTYECRIAVPAYEVGVHQAVLQNVTDSINLIWGTSEYSQGGAGNSLTTNKSIIAGRFTIAASKKLEILHKCGTTQTANGFGVQASLGSEVYTIAEFWKISEDGSGSGSGFSSRVSAYLGTDQTVTTGTWTKVELDTTQFDGLGEFDKSTNNRFVANTAGYYIVTGSVKFNGLLDGNGASVGIYQNGSVVADTHFEVGGGATSRLNVSKLVYLAANDYLELWARHYLGSDLTVGNGSSYTVMTIHRLS